MAIEKSLSSALQWLLLAAFAPASFTLTAQMLTPSAGIMILGRAANLTATVTPANAPGKVAFYDRATFLGSAQLLHGKAVLGDLLLPAGSHSLHATYEPAASFQKSTSPVAHLTIKALPGAGFPPPLFLAPPLFAALKGFILSATTADVNLDRHQ